jgi:hypothetical protein
MIIFTNLTNYAVFRVISNIIPGNKETYIKDLLEMWIRGTLISYLN